MAGYLELLRRPGAGTPWVGAILARIVLGMSVVSLVLLVRRSGFSYGEAGLAAALQSLGTAIGTPAWGKYIDRHGPVTLLRILGVGYGLAMILLAVVTTSGATILAVYPCAILGGFLFPPVSPVARVGWRHLYGRQLRDRAFSLDGVSVELGFVIGPILAAALVDGIVAWSGVVVAGLVMTTSTLAFTSCAMVNGMHGSPRTQRGGAMRVPAVRVLMAIFGIVAIAFGTIDILAPAVAERAGRDALTGVLLGSFALGSAIGGLVYGSRSWPSTRVNRLQFTTIVITVSFAALVFVTQYVWLFAVMAMATGLVIAPSLVIVFGLADDLTPSGVLTEALAWINTAIVLGAAVGAAIAGQMVERFGLQAAVLTGAAGLAVSALVTAVTRRTLSIDGPRQAHPAGSTASRQIVGDRSA